MAPGKARMMRVSHDYDRGGALAYLAAYDVHQAQVFGRCEATTGIEPFTAVVEQVMTQEPYASADRVIWGLLLHNPAKSALSQRLHRPRHDRATPLWL